MSKLLKPLKHEAVKLRIMGHCDLPGVAKPCPCFDAQSAYASLQPSL